MCASSHRETSSVSGRWRQAHSRRRRAVADPVTGLAVYNTFGVNGWLQVGGTSLSAPIIAAVIAMAGNGSALRSASELYQRASDQYDVTSGTNGANCSGAYLCVAVPSYDRPTGLGTPNGTTGFQ